MDDSHSKERLFMVNVYLGVRAFIIAVRYSYASKFRLMMLKKNKHSNEYIAKDLLLYSYILLTPEALKPEIEASFWRC